MLFFHHQHFVMPFPLRMYYILVSSPPPLQVPTISSIIEAGHPTLTAAFFGRK